MLACWFCSSQVNLASFCLLQAVRRAVLLILLGLFVNNGNDLANWRLPGSNSESRCCTPAQRVTFVVLSGTGILQRFGVAYLVVSLILVFAPDDKP